jgi:16S rRNA (cytosine1402-N4)-methyltransferase
LVREVLDLLITKADGRYVDGTVGAGGHAAAILGRLGPEGRLLGIDRDSDILKVARDRLGADARVELHHGSFDEISGDPVDGLLLDLGVSSLQFDEGERGFSFNKDAPLDMRMSRDEGDSAADLVATLTERELEKILKEFGEERFARRIAGMIVETRRKTPIETTTQLAALVGRAVPRAAWPRRLHPATRTFQGLRIAVNGELTKLDRVLAAAPRLLNPGGRIAVISYHSLEDRRVKQSFVEGERLGILRRLTKKPIVPSEEEVRDNPRSRSAKLRVAERRIAERTEASL